MPATPAGEKYAPVICRSIYNVNEETQGCYLTGEIMRRRVEPLDTYLEFRWSCYLNLLSESAKDAKRCTLKDVGSFEVNCYIHCLRTVVEQGFAALWSITEHRAINIPTSRSYSRFLFVNKMCHAIGIKVLRKPRTLPSQTTFL